MARADQPRADGGGADEVPAPAASPATGRLDRPRPDELDPTRRGLYDRIVGGPRARDTSAFDLTDADGRLHGPFNALLLAPEVGDALQELGAALRYRTGLADRTRELAILAVAAYHRSAFEWYAHASVARRLGLAEPVLDRVRAGEVPTDHLDDVEVVVLRTTRELLVSRDLDDPAYERAVAALGQEGLQELLALVGYYQLLALLLQVWRTPMPPGAAPAFGPPGTKPPSEPPPDPPSEPPGGPTGRE